MTSPSRLNITIIDCARDDAERLFAELREKLSPRGDVVSEAGRQRTVALFGEPLTPQQVVERICSDVRENGLAALLDYTRKLDGKALTIETLRVSPEELDEAHRRADPEYLATIRRIRENLREFQQAILNRDVTVTREEGGGRVELRQRSLPLRRVGVCVPGGSAAYPSTLLMTAVPAQVAGVKQIAVVAPPTEFGSYNADLLAACRELGVGEVYRIGGAQAVAALAYGVEGIERVDKIVGP
ncbi:MAG: histidinol dehydrogenase, partial [Planctomycetaceae bacterium]